MFDYGSGSNDDLDEAFGFMEQDDEAFDDESRRRRRPSGQVSPGAFAPSRPGVQSATITTPRGAASLRLPEEVVTAKAFGEAIQKVEAGVNRLSGAIADSRDAIDKMRRDQRLLARNTKNTISKLRQQQASQATMGMMTTFLLQQDQKKRLEGHTHGNGPPVDAATLPADNSLLYLLLPMMSSGGSGASSSGGDGGNSSSMMMMMLLLLGK